MKVVIIGAGNVGMGIGRRLSADGHDVVLIEQDERRIEEIRESVDADVRLGNGASILSLIEAGVRKADLLLAVGDNDESNVIASLVASKLGVKRTIARVRNVEFYVHPEVISSKEDLGVDLMINPESATAAEIVRLLEHSGASDMVELAGGKLQLVGVILDNEEVDIYGRPLAEVGSREDRARTRIIAIARGEDEVIVPTGRDCLQPGDHIYCITQTKHLGDLLRHCGKFDEEATHVVIFGATQVGCGVARSLSRHTKEVKIYDPDAERVMQAALSLPGALVNHGDGTELELLQSEDFGEHSAAVVVTDDEEKNILIGMLAKKAGAGKVVVLVRRQHYLSIAPEMSVDAVVNPQLVTVGEVLRFLRGENVLSLTALEGGNAEVMQFIARRGQKGVGVPLKELEFPSGCLIGALMKGDRAVIPTGNTVIEDGDQVIAFTKSDVASKLQELF